MVKILSTGGSGKVGSELISRLNEFISETYEIYFLKHINEIPINDIKNRKYHVIRKLPNIKFYDVALHFAANLHTRYGNDQKNKLIFYRDNVELTKNVCRCSDRVIFASSGYVFSGNGKSLSKETDPPNPSSNLYGQTKAEAEKIVLNEKGSVIRLETMIGVRSNLIIDNIYRAIDGKNYWPFWNDCFVRPAFFEDLLSIIKKVTFSDKNTIYHVSCNGIPLSRADLAKRTLNIHRKYNLPCKNNKLLEESCQSDFPRHLVLDTEKTSSELGLEFTSIDEALDKHVLKTRSSLVTNKNE